MLQIQTRERMRARAGEQGRMRERERVSKRWGKNCAGKEKDLKNRHNGIRTGGKGGNGMSAG